MIAAPADDFTALVLHVLAHVRMGGAGCSYDPRYVAWASERTPAELRELLRDDAAVLERAWSGGRAPAVVHAWPELLGSIAELRACASLELRELSAAQVRAPAVLAGLNAAARPELELLHATLCALAPWFAGWHADEVEPALRRAAVEVQAWLEPAAAVLPSLGAARIELACALGARGRAMPSRIVVGAPAPWHELDARFSVVLAMHEQSVIDAGHASYVDAEWAALTRLSSRMTEAPSELRRAHAQWLASLELRPLLDPLHAAGRITPAQRSALENEPRSRADRLAALAR